LPDLKVRPTYYHGLYVGLQTVRRAGLQARRGSKLDS